VQEKPILIQGDCRILFYQQLSEQNLHDVVETIGGIQ
jgi:hypothetical protein